MKSFNEKLIKQRVNKLHVIKVYIFLSRMHTQIREIIINLFYNVFDFSFNPTIKTYFVFGSEVNILQVKNSGLLIRVKYSKKKVYSNAAKHARARAVLAVSALTSKKPLAYHRVTTTIFHPNLPLKSIRYFSLKFWPRVCIPLYAIPDASICDTRARARITRRRMRKPLTPWHRREIFLPKKIRRRNGETDALRPPYKFL